MTKTNRRTMLQLGLASVCVPCGIASQANAEGEESNSEAKVQYLEIVTAEAKNIQKTYEQMLGVTFGEPVASFGGARTVKLKDGSMIGIRPPLRDDEKPVVRPYMLVEDIQKAVDGAEGSGAKVAIPPMKIEEHGSFAVLIQGGIEFGLWEL